MQKDNQTASHHTYKCFLLWKKRFCFGDRQEQHYNRNWTELAAWAYHSCLANLVGPVTIASMLAQLPPFASTSAPDKTGNRQHATARSSSSLNRIWSDREHTHKHMHTWYYRYTCVTLAFAQHRLWWVKIFVGVLRWPVSASSAKLKRCFPFIWSLCVPIGDCEIVRNPGLRFAGHLCDTKNRALILASSSQGSRSSATSYTVVRSASSWGWCLCSRTTGRQSAPTCPNFTSRDALEVLCHRLAFAKIMDINTHRQNLTRIFANTFNQRPAKWDRFLENLLDRSLLIGLDSRGFNWWVVKSKSERGRVQTLLLLIFFTDFWYLVFTILKHNDKLCFGIQDFRIH